MPRAASIRGALQRTLWPYAGVMVLGLVAYILAQALLVARTTPQSVLTQGRMHSHAHWPSWVLLGWTCVWLALGVRGYRSRLLRMCRAVVCVSCGYEICARLIDVQGDEICCHECGTRMDRAEYAVIVRSHGRGLARALFGKARWLTDQPVMGPDEAGAAGARHASHYAAEAVSCENMERVMARSERRRIIIIGVALVLYAAGAWWLLTTVEPRSATVIAWSAIVGGVVFGGMMLCVVYLPLVWRKHHLCSAVICARCDVWIAGRIDDVEGDHVTCAECGFSVTKAEYAAYVRGYGARLAERIWGKGARLAEPDVLLPSEKTCATPVKTPAPSTPV
ncbi:MAG: hypothetical protein AB7G17_09010 [Phycisphaerales bacterium]